MTDGPVEYKQDDKAVRQHVGMYCALCEYACARVGKKKKGRQGKAVVERVGEIEKDDSIGDSIGDDAMG